jgi:cysteine synthase
MVQIDAGASTPLVRLSRFSREKPVYAKLEHLLLTGGAFDRVASKLVSELEPEILSKGTVVVAGSGSVCLAFAAALARINAKTMAVCARTMLPEHRMLLGMHRLQLVLAEGTGRFDAVHRRAEEEAKRTGGALLYTPRLERNVDRLFEETAGRDLAAQLTASALADSPELTLVAPFASSGMLLGVARALSSRSIKVRTLATVLPPGAFESRQDDIETLDRCPTNTGVEYAVVEDSAALETRAQLAKSEGLLVGLSSAGAIRVAKEHAGTSPTIVLVLDAGDRYFSVDREASAKGAPK